MDTTVVHRGLQKSLGNQSKLHNRRTAKEPDGGRLQKPIKGKCARCDYTDSCRNVQGIRSRQDYPVNSQPRGFMRNQSLRQPHVKDSHDTSILRILVRGKYGRTDSGSKERQQMKEVIRKSAAGRRHSGGLCDSIQCQDSQARFNVRQLQCLGGSTTAGTLHHVMSSSTSSPNVPEDPGKPLLSVTKSDPS
ncbi:hypothetical protein B9Z55_010950 [Caenorhabditis nigoni]|uniref:Uncharacterized protein n=1 Tax=Caenorhabditis nigoni TaxID=1611254 RepID=A0A2G5UI08_9PELO|nr:hypothetical protein B9Z55_010950 [Caenorhabditis nigoni]